MDKQEAYETLDEHHGRAILVAEVAEAVADAFGVELKRNVKELDEIKNMDRLQPDEERRGIGVGTLCKVIVDRSDDVTAEAEGFTAIGHGTTQDGLKDRNLPKIAEVVDG